MSVEENLRVIEAFSRAFDERRWDRFFELHAQSAALWAPGLAEPLKGRAAIREWELGFVGGFPDFRFRTDQPFGHGRLVCFQWTFTGTHTAPLPGPGGKAIPATNKPVRIRGCSVYTVEGGEITERRLYFDQLEFLQQLGLAP